MNSGSVKVGNISLEHGHECTDKGRAQSRTTSSAKSIQPSATSYSPPGRPLRTYNRKAGSYLPSARSCNADRLLIPRPPLSPKDARLPSTSQLKQHSPNSSETYAAREIPGPNDRPLQLSPTRPIAPTLTQAQLCTAKGKEWPLRPQEDKKSLKEPRTANQEPNILSDLRKYLEGEPYQTAKPGFTSSSNWARSRNPNIPPMRQNCVTDSRRSSPACLQSASQREPQRSSSEDEASRYPTSRMKGSPFYCASGSRAKSEPQNSISDKAPAERLRYFAESRALRFSGMKDNLPVSPTVSTSEQRLVRNWSPDSLCEMATCTPASTDTANNRKAMKTQPKCFGNSTRAEEGSTTQTIARAGMAGLPCDGKAQTRYLASKICPTAFRRRMTEGPKPSARPQIEFSTTRTWANLLRAESSQEVPPGADAAARSHDHDAMTLRAVPTQLPSSDIVKISRMSSFHYNAPMKQSTRLAATVLSGQRSDAPVILSIQETPSATADRDGRTTVTLAGMPAIRLSANSSTSGDCHATSTLGDWLSISRGTVSGNSGGPSPLAEIPNCYLEMASGACKASRLFCDIRIPASPTDEQTLTVRPSRSRRTVIISTMLLSIYPYFPQLKTSHPLTKP